MPSIQEIYDELCRIAPPELQLGFDNAGFLIGRAEREVQRVLLSLDITTPVIQEAAAFGAELIVAHHPVIFHGIKSLRPGGEAGRALLLAEKGIGAVCMHTNLDIAEGGVNDVLIRLLGAEPEEALDAEGCGRVGTLPEPQALEDFLRRCKERLRANGLRYVPGMRPVHRLAVMGGAGADALLDAARKDCDTYVTSDVKYHVFLEAAELGINLIDADHFCTENPVIPVLAERLREAFPELELRISRVHSQTARFF
jgi:dinuclear metal center YbgI/SA1388 family protein